MQFDVPNSPAGQHVHFRNKKYVKFANIYKIMQRKRRTFFRNRAIHLYFIKRETWQQQKGGSLMASNQQVAPKHNLTITFQLQFDYKKTELHNNKVQKTRSGLNPARTHSLASLKTFCSKASLAFDVCQKVLLFGSFHKIQETSKTMESKVRRAAPSILCLLDSHQGTSSP